MVPLAVLSHVARAKGDAKAAYDYLGSALGYGVEHHFIYPLIICLPAAALLAAEDRNRRKAVELYGLAKQFRYITNSCWFEDIACRELDSMRDSLPPEVARAAEDRGREQDVWETAETLLRELRAK